MGKSARWFAWVLVGAVALIASWIGYARHPELWSRYRDGLATVSAIEHFQREHGRLPDHLSEISGVSSTEEGPIYYMRKSPTRYIVWFSRSLGESFTYDSSSRSWH